MSSPALAEFMKSLGKVQHHVHTAVVGLAAVETGTASCPDDLDISWSVTDPVGAARESRQFILRSSIVFVAELLSEYSGAHLRYLKLTDPSIELPQSAADRIRLVGRRAQPTPEYLTPAAVLLRQWRNRIVHRGSDAGPTHDEEAILIDCAAEIAERVKHLNVRQLLEHFAGNRPTLKDTTSLVSIAIRFVRSVDKVLPAIDSPTEVGRWLELLKLKSDVMRYERQAANGGSKDPRRAGRQFLVTTAPALAEPYYRFGAA